MVILSSRLPGFGVVALAIRVILAKLDAQPAPLL